MLSIRLENTAGIYNDLRNKFAYTDQKYEEANR